MNTNTNELRKLAEAAKEWSNVTEIRSDRGDYGCTIGEMVDGEFYPVVTVECESYYADSMPLAAYIAAANPATVIGLLDEIDRLRTEAVAADIRIGNDALVIAGLTAERDAKGKTMIDFKLQATGIPESIEQYQLALDAAFTAGKAIAAGAAPPNVLMNQLINDKVELQHKLDDALHKADAERDAAQTDAKRLEWLSQQGVSFGFQDIYEGNKWEIGGPYATLRIAIDAEMKGEQP